LLRDILNVRKLERPHPLRGCDAPVEQICFSGTLGVHCALPERLPQQSRKRRRGEKRKSRLISQPGFCFCTKPGKRSAKANRSSRKKLAATRIARLRQVRS
jgi:hypothetical protein